MIRVFDTLVGRTIFVSLIGISLMHVLSLWSYELALDHELSAVHEAGLADRLLTIRRSLSIVPEAGRDDVAHQLSGGPVEVHWSKTERAVAGGSGLEQWASLPARLMQRAPDITAQDLSIGSAGPQGDSHVALVSLRLPDKSWVNVSLFAFSQPRSGSHGTLLSTTFMALGVVLLSVFIASWLTKPIRIVAAAARSLHPGNESTRIPETGPREVRDLAAVSHDLRTPLTRLKLRIEDLGNPDLSRAMSNDIVELEQMIDATLSYLKGEGQTEATKSLDLTALLETLVDEATDLGQLVQLSGPRHLIIRGRHLGLKRALSNLIQNAVKYGTQARITTQASSAGATVHIDDDGPGIPADKLDTVLEPFVRLETSRSRETGGVGLGLTIAKASIEADGGHLTLENRPDGGLRVTVTLPNVSWPNTAGPKAA
jgi:two-component system, OmpR family, sensor kinase